MYVLGSRWVRAEDLRHTQFRPRQGVGWIERSGSTFSAGWIGGSAALDPPYDSAVDFSIDSGNWSALRSIPVRAICPALRLSLSKAHC